MKLKFYKSVSFVFILLVLSCEFFDHRYNYELINSNTEIDIIVNYVESKNITIRNNTISNSRRNNISLVDGENIFLSTGGNATVKFYLGKASYSTDTFVIKSNEENLIRTKYLFYFAFE